jgi:hypothetical protein
MERRPAAAVALVAVLLLAGCTVGYQPAADTPEPTAPPDTDHPGQYGGYWYNDTFDLEPATGLTPGQQEAVFSRAMARVQLLRGLEFESDVDVEVISRGQFREQYRDEAWPEPEPGVRALDNAQHEALFLVGPDEDVVEVRQANRGGVVLGFYEPGPERLVIVGGRNGATLKDEITLAHELVHALQDQRFGGLPAPETETLDAVNARNALVEGEAVVVAAEYERRCDSGEWQCVEVDGGQTTGETPGGFNWGVYFAGFFPYAEGPTFVEHHRNTGGWDAVDRMHDDVPAASAEILAPETYDTDSYGTATLADRSTDEWERITTDRGVDFATVGQAGLASMFAQTAYTDRPHPSVIDRSEFRNSNGGSLDRLRPFTYNISYVEGWYADRLYGYESDGERAHVWNVTFNDAANASEFHDGYREVVEYWGGDRTGSRGGGAVWTFETTDRFGGAVWVERDGNTVVVVKAPGVGELGAVHAPAG